MNNSTHWTFGSLIYNTANIKTVAPVLIRLPCRRRVVLLIAVQNSRKYLTAPRSRQIPRLPKGVRRSAKHQTTAVGKTSRIRSTEKEKKKLHSEREYLRTVKRWRVFDPRQDGRASRGWGKKKEKQPLPDVQEEEEEGRQRCRTTTDPAPTSGQ